MAPALKMNLFLTPKSINELLHLNEVWLMTAVSEKSPHHLLNFITVPLQCPAGSFTKTVFKTPCQRMLNRVFEVF